MQKESAQKLLFVINPVSGGNNKNNWEASIRNYFKTLPHTIELYLLDGKNDSASIRHYLQSVNPQKVVAVGGDGTIKLLTEALQQTGIPLGIIPAGSANGMARELSIPDKLEEALEVILKGQCREIDTIRIGESDLCIHLSDLGLNAMLVKHFEDSQSRGMWGYARGLFKVLWHKRWMLVHLKTDTETIRRKAFMVVLANARTYGTGAIINPDGQLDDGRFEIVVVRKLHLLELLKMLLTHRPFDPKRIEVFAATQVEISVYKKAYFQVDGEYRGKTNLLQAYIQPKSLKVMVPLLPEA